MSTFNYESTISSLRSSIIVASDTTNTGLIDHLCMSMTAWLPVLDSLEEEYNRVAFGSEQEHQKESPPQGSFDDVVPGYSDLNNEERGFLNQYVSELLIEKQHNLVGILKDFGELTPEGQEIFRHRIKDTLAEQRKQEAEQESKQ